MSSPSSRPILDAAEAVLLLALLAGQSTMLLALLGAGA
jgi:hypothetical protein